ncbi:hypothetical protein HMPREF3161_06215, partial [Aerococcus sp. HMSC06H08]
MREEGTIAIRRLTDKGITPAYAGRSVLLVQVYSPKQDHPRVCGKKPLTPNFARRILGSPPRMREED